MLEIDWKRGWLEAGPIARTVTCFCDIANVSLTIHGSQCGQCGAGVDRKPVPASEGRPVIFTPELPRNGSSARGSYFRHEAISEREDLDDFFPDQPQESERHVGASPVGPTGTLDLAGSLILEMLVFVKTFNVEPPEGDPENYCMEQEWRNLANLPLQLPVLEIIAPTRSNGSIREELPVIRNRCDRAV